MKKENSNCLLCGFAANSRELEKHTDSGTEYVLRECPACQGQFWFPFKNPGAEWYEKDTRYAGRNADPDLEPNWHQKKTIYFIPKEKGKLLDIGCGAGTFMYWAGKRGWDVSGIDFDRDAIRTAREVFKLKNAEVADLRGYLAAHPGERFDLITFFDVFEHIDNHREFLAEVRGALVPNGYISMSMPYRGAARWLQPADLPPRHLTRWNREAIKNYLEANGFEVVYLKRLSAGIGFLVSKLQRRYGKYFSFNIIGRMKKTARKEGIIELGSRAEKKIEAAHKLARVKDCVLFGIPAFFVWLAMLFTEKRYIGLLVIAKKRA